MTTFIIMQNRIATEIVRDDLAEQIKNAINDAIVTWEGVRFAFNERRYLINTVADQEYYDLVEPTLLFHDGSTLETNERVLEVDSIRITVNNSYYPLTPRTQQWFDRNSGPASQYTGQPDSYGIYSTQLRLFPIPDGVYALEIAGLARLGPHPLVNDVDTNNWTIGVAASALIRAQAKLLIYRDIVRDPDGRATAAEAVSEAQWQLERKGTAQTMTGTQRAWDL